MADNKHGEEIRARAERVEQWANLYGDDIAGQLRDEDDDDTVSVIDDALWCAHYCFDLLSRLEAAEADARQYEAVVEAARVPASWAMTNYDGTRDMTEGWTPMFPELVAALAALGRA